MPRNKVKTYAFYGAITVIGIALGVFKVTAFFKWLYSLYILFLISTILIKKAEKYLR